MFIFYDLVFLIFSILYLPIFLLKRKFHAGFMMRLGFLPKEMEFDHPIWVHAVSVGEVMAVKNLIRQLKVAYPKRQIVLSTVTPTGNKVARGFIQGQDKLVYLPLDFSFIVRSFVDRVSPALFIVAETEIWPNLLSCLAEKKIPQVVVNGRISDASFAGYSRIRFFLKRVFNKIDLFCVQTARDALRLQKLGVPENKIKITGNMKFDVTDYTDVKNEYTDLKKKLGLGFEDRLFVAGSTHAGEEEIILHAYKGLLNDHPHLRLLIAPRHPERAQDIEKLAIKKGFKPSRVSQLASFPVSQLKQATSQPANRSTVFILDTVGELLSYYAVSDIVFIGGSLARKGGHNILEPASMEKPVLFGPHMFNFRDIAQLFTENQAGVLVRGGDDLKGKISGLLNSAPACTVLGEKARALILKNQGATLRNLEWIKNYGN